MNLGTTDEAWARLEAEWFSSPLRYVDRIRVRGYALATCERVKLAHEELERKVTLMLRARADAERALEDLREELDHAELLAEIAALDDASINEEVALLLERLEDVA